MDKKSPSKFKKTMTNATTKSSSKRTMTSVTTKSSSKSKRNITNTNSSRSKSIKTALTKPRSNAKSKKLPMTSTTKKSRSNSKSKKPMTTKSRSNSKSHSHNTKLNGTTSTSAIKIMSDQEEMDLIEATCSQYSSFYEINYRTIHTNIRTSTISAKRSFSNFASSSATAAKKCPQPPDIEDSCDFWRTTQKRRKLAPSSLFKRFRNTTGLFVTDITGTV